MKYFQLLFSVLLISIFFGCAKNSHPIEIPCEEECLFTLSEVSGTVIRMDCFDKFGFSVINPDTTQSAYIYIIPDFLKSKYLVADKQVRMSAICRQNILEPRFPDPQFNLNSLYQAEIVYIEETE